MPTPVAATVWTVGHSTRTFDAFPGLLAAHGVTRLADVRRFPGSRRYPHFNADHLAAHLPGRGIDYVPMPELGGRRRPAPDSRSTAWRNDAFRAYGDFMSTPEFASGLARLLGLAAERPTAIMCSEAVWWRCHRGLIADALKARGITVLHIESERPPKEHPYTGAARIVGGRLSYRAEDGARARDAPADRGLFG